MAASNQYAVAARRAARQHGIPPSLFLTLVRWESGWRPGVVSPAGAIGLTQLMPGTARGLGVDPYNPIQNLNGGAKYLRQAYNHFGSWKLALAAYNAGWGAVTKYGGIPPYAETQRYVNGILGASHAARALGPVIGHQTATHSLMTAPQPKVPDLASLAFENLSHIAAGTYTPEGSLAALGQTIGSAGTSPATPAVSTPTPLGTPAISTIGGSKIDRVVVHDALHFLGTPYAWGGSHPGGFDCSGLLQYVWGKRGVRIPRTTYEQIRAGTPVSGALRPGDAVFFGTSSNPHHVGMFIGNGRFIEAPHTGASVRISRLKGRSDYLGARRYA